MSQFKKYLINAVLFQAGWLICVFFGSLLGALATALILSFHFWVIVRPHDRAFEAKTLALALVVGFFVELGFVWFQVLLPVDGSQWPPLWLLMIWLLFATTLNCSLSWLKGRLALAALLGAVSAPGSYYGGAALSPAMDFSSPSYGLVVIALCWALLLPLLFFIIQLLTVNTPLPPEINKSAG